MRIIDSHVHVLNNYKPMTPFADSGQLDRLLYLMDDADVDQAIMLPVVAEFSPNNNAECANWARQYPDRLATMTDIPLHAGNATELVLEAKEKYDCIGISYYPNSGDISWMLSDENTKIWEAFSTTKLVCNLQVVPANHKIFFTLAQRNPQVNFVCNHLGLPGSFNAEFPDYKQLGMANKLDNVFVKASAFYAASHTPWDPRCKQALNYLTELLELFGPNRILWGTDWPPTSKHLTYRQALEIVLSYCPVMDDKSRKLVLGENAAKLFSI